MKLLLSFHQADRDVARIIKRHLAARQVKVTLAEPQSAGQAWYQHLKNYLNQVSAVAFLIGPAGLSRPQKRLLGPTLRYQHEQQAKGYPFIVVPILLTEADLPTAFLFRDQWLDFSDEVSNIDPLLRLLQSDQRMTAKRPAAVMVDLCPYRGLRAFREEDAAFFYGREATVTQLAEMVARQKWVTLFGPTGSGKTSLIQAGLLPYLRYHLAPNALWEPLVVSLATTPFEELAATLLAGRGARLDEIHALSHQLAQGELTLAAAIEDVFEIDPESSPFLLIVDQFEVLFTEIPEVERAAFIAMLIATQDPQSPISILVVLDQALYGQAIGFDAALKPNLTNQPIHLEPLTLTAIQQAILQPARLVTTGCEPALVQQLIEEMTDLSALSYTLQQLWQRHQAGLLSQTSYKQIGGMAGAIDHRAEVLYDRLSPPQQQQLKQICLKLVDVGFSTGAQRRWLDLTMLSNLGPTEDLYQCLQPFIDEGLVLEQRWVDPDSDRDIELRGAADLKKIRLASDLIIRHWRRLGRWLDEEREFLLWRVRLPQEEPNRRPYLVAAEARRWHQARSERLSQDEQAFIQRELGHHHWSRRLRWAVGFVMTSLVLFILTGVIVQQNHRNHAMTVERDLVLTAQAQAVLAREVAENRQETAEVILQEAEQRRQLALARQLAVQSDYFVDQDAEDGAILGTLLAVESLRRRPSRQAEQALRRGLSRLPRPTTVLPHEAKVFSTVFSPDGRRLVTRSGPIVQIWDVERDEIINHLTHTSAVSDMTFSPDGYWLATASMTHIVQVWDVSTGREVGRLRHNTPIWNVTFSPDGHWLITRNAEVVYAWQLSDNTVGQFILSRSERRSSAVAQSVARALTVQRLNRAEPPPETRQAIIGPGSVQMRPGSLILDMAVSPNNQWLVTVGGDQGAVIWEMATGREVARLPHNAVVRAVAFNHNGLFFATGSADGTVHLWSVPAIIQASRIEETTPSQVEAETSITHPAGVNMIAFSPDGRWLATGAVDHIVRTWLVVRGPNRKIDRVKPGAEMSHADRLQALAFSPDSRWLATASANRTAQVWWVATGQKITQMVHGAKVNDVTFSPDGRWLATASFDHSAQLWEVTIGFELSQMDHNYWVDGVIFSPNGRWIATRSARIVKIWEANTGREGVQLTHDKPVNTIAFSVDGRWLATASNHQVNLWETESGREILQIEHGGLVRTLAFGLSGTGVAKKELLVVAGIDKVARLWDIAEGKLVAKLVHEDWVNAVALSPDGQWVATASNDNTARVWDATTGREVARLVHEKVVNDVIFSPDSEWVATASGDSTARLWTTASQQEVARLSHQASVSGVKFSPDGQWLATHSTTMVRSWRVSNGQAVAEMVHDRAVAGVIFSPDSRTLATAGGDRQARIWDVETGTVLAQLEHDYWVNDVAFSPDGRWLATASADHLARVWFLDPNDLLTEACLRLPRNLSQTEWAEFFSSEPYQVTCEKLPEGF